MSVRLTEKFPRFPETVVLIDDDSSVRRALAGLLRSAGHRVESFSSPAEFLATTPRERAGCMVLDLRMPGMTGLQLQRELARHQPQLPIIFITGYGTVSECARAMKYGAVDFLEKPFEDEDLLAAVRSALEQHRSEAAARSEQEAIAVRLQQLTPREHQVLQGVISGMLNKQIATRLGISIKTTKTHRGRMMAKMGVDSVAELTLLAQKIGLEPWGGRNRRESSAPLADSFT